MHSRDLRIPATDGYELGATLHRAREPGGTVIVNPATGTPRRFYHPYASFLADRGLTAVTYDYRGVADSLPEGRARGFQARMGDWGRRDFAGVLAWVRATDLPGPRFVVAHSVGFQILGLAPEIEDVRAIVGVAPPHGYWRNYPPADRYLLALLWYVGAPLLTRLLGYFPSSLIGFGEDLPAGVAREWASWCRDPEYLFGGLEEEELERYRAIECPALVLTFSDDRIAPEPSVDALLARFPALEPARREVAPREVGRDEIGHFGFFRERPEDVPLWTETAEWLRERCP